MPRPTLLALLFTALFSLAFWPSSTYGTDPLAYREEARALLAGRLHTDPPPTPPSPQARLSRPGDYFVQNPRNALWYSKYGVFNAVASLPPLLAERLTTGALPAFDSSTRLTWLNAYNTVLTTLLAWLLVRLARLYTDDPRTAAAFALACLFTTFLWYYTRAQSTELVQVLLATAGWTSLTLHLRTARPRHLAALWLILTAMVLTRVYFLTLLPVVFLAALYPLRQTKPLIARAILAALLPALALLSLLALLNHLKFGSPLSTGYHAFEPQRHLPTFDPRPGLYGFLLSPQKAVWWHFPLLLLALPFYPAFARRHRTEAAVLLVAAALNFLPLCTIPSWAGEWSYGPRYLLFALPVIALPAVLLPPWLAARPPLLRRATIAATVVLLLAGTWLTLQTNRLGFFAAHELRSPLRRAAGIRSTATTFIDDDADYPGRRYWSSRPLPLILHDLLAAEGDIEHTPLWPDAAPHLTPAQQQELRRTARAVYTRHSSYWSSP